MDNDPNNPAAPARSGQATGYATDADAAMAHLSEPAGIVRIDVLEHFGYAPANRIPNLDRIAAKALAAEVIRIRAERESDTALLDFLEKYKGCSLIMRDRERTTWRAMIRYLMKSHNKPELSDGSTKTNPNT